MKMELQKKWEKSHNEDLHIAEVSIQSWVFFQHCDWSKTHRSRWVVWYPLITDIHHMLNSLVSDGYLKSDPSSSPR